MQIELHGITKTFQVYERPQGKGGLLRGAFTRQVRLKQLCEPLGVDGLLHTQRRKPSCT
ncbi:hypothetical protein [Gorillibacterium sp. CAU 1737]|uniref:hypothetical protein n=1 Tax=Gorillibacterium sp. CAU 1737 TaxID=3140362 RepID=UPI0032610B69